MPIAERRLRVLTDEDIAVHAEATEKAVQRGMIAASPILAEAIIDAASSRAQRQAMTKGWEWIKEGGKAIALMWLGNTGLHRIADWMNKL